MTSSAKDIAAWMVETIKAEKPVDQEHLVRDIEEKFGREWEHYNGAGNPAIKPSILSQFRKLHDSAIEWDRSDRSWSYAGS
jgi:hypothetical protein